MKPTMEILRNVERNSKRNNDEVFTRLYRYMLRPDLYYVAYQKLYANRGAGTKGVNEDTADGFGEKKLQKIIAALENETYTPNPVRRIYIEKSNGKMRPLGIPTFSDKLVQEVLRMILEAVYEPIFLPCSHGFRPNRSCHSALQSIKWGFKGIRWFIESDIKSCFDSIDHVRLVEIIGTKIKDARLIQLVWKFLKAGYVEEWKYNKTYSGTPQGGIISPMLSNIYLHEMDKYMNRLAGDYNKPARQKITNEYRMLNNKLRCINKRIKKTVNREKSELLRQKREIKAEMRKTPYKSQTDKKLKYIRYADDSLIGINGSREDCVRIKHKLSEFVKNELKMELSEEKTLITHSNTYARFLGYNIRVRRNGKVKPYTDGRKQRSLNGSVDLSIPLTEKVMKFLFEKKAIRQKRDGKRCPARRSALLRCTELEIISTYNAELRGICNYYSIASNFYKLNYFAYLMEYSCLKTLAGKYKSTCAKMWRKYRDGKGKWGIPYETKNGRKCCYFAKYAECRNRTNVRDEIEKVESIHKNRRTTLESRLAAKKCELCNTAEAGYYEIHHINKVKNLKGKSHWERIMIAKRRKTMVVCWDCHQKIHHHS